MRTAPTTQRVTAIIEMMESVGLYTHAEEIHMLDRERNKLEAQLKIISDLNHTKTLHLCELEAIARNKHGHAITPDVPEGFDTVLGYLAKFHPEVLDAMDYSNPCATQRDGYWLKHNADDYRVVAAPPVLRACGINVVNAWPLSALARRFG